MLLDFIAALSCFILFGLFYNSAIAFYSFSFLYSTLLFSVSLPSEFILLKLKGGVFIYPNKYHIKTKNEIHKVCFLMEDEQCLEMVPKDHGVLRKSSPLCIYLKTRPRALSGTYSQLSI